MLMVVLAACSRDVSPDESAASAVAVPEAPSPSFRNVADSVRYVGDAPCVRCHVRESEVYRQHSMSRSFHAWTSATRMEARLDSAIFDPRTGLAYEVVEQGGRLYQVEFIRGEQGRRLHELRKRIDYVMGSGHVARTYFTEENGRLFQLPLTWYSRRGWDFSPGYRVGNARFDRLMPDRCIACHSSYPEPVPNVEGKYARLREGIGCERCHGPGALHVASRSTARGRAGAMDGTIVNPARLPIARRLDTCEQCHVHTAVSVPREGRNAFSYIPSQPLRDTWAFFKVSGSIDIVSHADRLRQSACFRGTVSTARPLECATCHDPHAAPPDAATLNRPCVGCHVPDSLQRRFNSAAARDVHAPDALCVTCHMPKVQEQGIPHGTFTEHWIRVIRDRASVMTRTASEAPIEPFFERDRTGDDGAIYRGMGTIVYGTLATNAAALREGAADLRAALGNDSTRAHAWFLLGVAEDQTGQSVDALAALERAVRIDSTRPDALRAVAHTMHLTGADPKRVDALYRRALAIQPALAWIRAEYADVLWAQGRTSDADDEYRAAIAEQPGSAIPHFDRGLLNLALARQGTAERSLGEAVRLDPTLAQALTALLDVHGDSTIQTVRVLDTPLPTVLVRDRGPRATRITSAVDGRSAVFLNVPAGALVQIFSPDGTLLRSLRMGSGLILPWDMRTTAGRPIAGGLYRARMQPRGGASPNPSQTFLFSVVRTR